MKVALVNGKLEIVTDDGQLSTLNAEEVGDDRINGSGSMAFVWRSFAKTEAGSQFYEEYYDDPRNQQKLLDVFRKLYPDQKVTCSRLVDAYSTALAAGEFVAKQPEATTTARDERGRFADEHTLLRQEVRRMLSDSSVPAAAIRQRAASDPAFAEAWRAELTPVAPAAPPPPDDLPELKAFVKRWRNAKDVRPIGGVVTLVDHEYTVAELEDLITRASAAGLL